MFGQSNTPFGSPPGGGGFGATNTAPAFGSPAPAPFGAPSSGFGGTSTAFGTPAPAPTGFGATNTFGAAPSTGFGGGGFGAPAPAPTGFGGGAFGSSNTASPFGAPAPAPTGGLFGNAPAPSGGLFGSSGTTNTGFGGTTSTFGGFGSSTTGGFGAPSQPSAFGAPAPAPSTGLFGAPAPAPPAFGASTGGFGSTSAFGSPAPAPGGSLFGSPPAAAPGLFGAAPAAAAPGGGGTRTTPFQATSRQDGTSTIMMQSISAMPAYESKSFEELRFEDYAQGNRGSSSAPVGGSTFGFGAAPAPSGGLFGGGAPAPAPFGASTGGAFGAPAPAPFGAPAATPFGAPAPGGFGAPAPAPFGAPAPAPFGAPAPATGFGGGAFGKAPATGLFGAPAPSGGLFGSAPAPAFGAAPASGGLFGSTPAPAPTGGLFGAPAPAAGGLFGSPSPAPAFGAAPAPAPGGLFGAPAPAPGGLFGSSAPAPAFGAPAPGSSLFGAPAPSGGLFGNRSPGTSLFGAPAPAPGMFGAPAPTPPTSLFGAPAPPPAAPAALPPVGTIIPPAANDVLAHQLAALEKKRQEIEKLDVWRGESSTSAIAMPANNPEPIPVVPTTSSFRSYRASPRSTAKVRPRGFGSPFPSTSDSIAQSPLNSFARSRPLMSPDTYAVSSIKHLVVNPESQTPKPKVRLRLTNSPATADTGAIAGALPAPAERVEDSVDAMKKSPGSTEKKTSIQVYTRGTPTSVGKDSAGSPYLPETNSQKTPTNLESKDLTSPGLSYYQKIVGSPDASESKAEETENSNEPSYLPKLSKPGYVVTPSLDEMSKLSEASLATLSGFSVERSPFGKVEWDGEVDVRNADLDRIVEIKQNDVSVYMKDEEEGTKPKVGSKLNRPAVITFFNVFPKNGGADADAATRESFRKKIAKSTVKMDAELLSYDDESGEWKIRVLHFSRYGLDDSDDDDDEVAEPKVFSPEGDRSTGRWNDEMEDADAAVVSDAEMSENNESRFVRETNSAYAALFEAAHDQPKSPSSPVVESDIEMEEQRFNEVEYSDAWDGRSSWEDVGPEDYDWAASTGGISSRLASKIFSGRTVPNSNDFGRRMGRSFRVGWSPDGSFVRLGAPKNGSPVLTFDRPVFSKSDSKESGVEYLETHKEKATRKEASLDGSSPRFYLPLSLRNSGDQSSDNALYEALQSYASLFNTSSKESDLIIPRAFALLASLLDGTDDNVEMEDAPKESAHRFMNSRRREAVRRMFAEACKSDVEEDILIAQQGSDVHSAAFAALSGGDVEKASNLAADMGQFNLAVLLACGFTGGSEILDQVKMSLENPLASSSTIPETLLRIYRLLGGDLEGERKLVKRNASRLDWKRHFLLRLVFDKSVRRLDTEVADVVRRYMADVRSGFAPHPRPQYMASIDRASASQQCLLFRILRLTVQPQELSSLEVVDPLGIHTNIHDFVGSFHLASALSAMGICSPLSELDESRLIDGYAAQLVSQGKWEWAVYVSLCSLNPGKVAGSTWKLQRAKELVLRHFTPADPLAAERQQVLVEDIGVPEEWLDEALANWYSCGNNPFPYIQHLAMYSPLEASKVVDDAIIPNLLFMSKVDLRKGLLLLESFGSYLSPMGSAVYNLFELSKDIRFLISADRNEIDENLSAMFEVAKDIEKTLRTCRAECDHKADRTPVRKWYSYESVPLSSMLAEAWDHLMFLKLQMKALEAGIPLSSEITSKRLTAQMAFMALDESYVKFINETDVIRGLR